jgi:hypothetical protein
MGGQGLGLETRAPGTFISFVFFYLLTTFLGSNYVLKNRGVQWRTATTITGSNDAGRVVWALGVCFLNFLFVFLWTNQFFFSFT